MKNIIPISHFLTSCQVAYKREENMGIEVMVDDLDAKNVDMGLLAAMASESNVKNMGSIDHNGKVWWRIWIDGKVSDWDVFYRLFYKPFKV